MVVIGGEGGVGGYTRTRTQLLCICVHVGAVYMYVARWLTNDTVLLIPSV